MIYRQISTRSNLKTHQLDWIIFPRSSIPSLDALPVILLDEDGHNYNYHFITIEIPNPTTTPIIPPIGKLLD
jgi:hypothetical protein